MPTASVCLDGRGYQEPKGNVNWPGKGNAPSCPPGKSTVQVGLLWALGGAGRVVRTHQEGVAVFCLPTHEAERRPAG